MLLYNDSYLMNTPIKTRQSVNLEKIKHLRASISKKILDDDRKLENLQYDELNDFNKILQICEFILEKYQNKKTLTKNLKKYIDIIDSTLSNLELIDDEINQLSISANFSLNKLQEFKSDLIKSKDFPEKHHVTTPIYQA